MHGQAALWATLFDQTGFMPHGHCYLWKPGLVWLHAGSDFIIGLAYVSISVSLYALMRKINLPFRGMFFAFGLFIGACGVTHFMEVWTLWRTDYWASGAVKLVTAGASIATALLLYPISPQVAEVAREAKLAEQHRLRLQEYSAELETRVAARTADLEAALAEREQALVQLRASQARFQALMEAAPVIFWISDETGATRFVNEQWVAFTGLPKEAAMGSGWSEVIPQPDLDRQLQAWRRAVESLTPMNAEARFKRRDGVYRWQVIQAVPVRENGGHLWIGAAIDIEDQKRAVALRDEFLSIASHELRTPLTSISMRLQTLERQARRGDLRDLPQDRVVATLDSVNSQVRRLASLTDQLLDISRLTAGHFPINAEPTDLGAIAEDIVEQYRAEAEAHRSPLSFTGEGDLRLTADRARLEQVVSNLVSNAIKFGAGKPIAVAVRALGGALELTVADRGPGVPPPQRAAVFERFERGAASRNIGGLGLGLYISREIVTRHGGDIGVEDAPGGGSLFRVRLPRAG